MAVFFKKRRFIKPVIVSVHDEVNVKKMTISARWFYLLSRA